MTSEEWEEERELELDANLTALFQSVAPLQPTSGFAARTLRAVRRETLPAGRHALGRPWSLAVGWAAVIVGTAVAAYGIVENQPLIAGLFASLVAGSVRAGVWLLQCVSAGVELSDLLTTTGLTAARVVATREGAAGLMLMTITGALSLSALHRLLFVEEETSRWQELS